MRRSAVLFTIGLVLFCIGSAGATTGKSAKHATRAHARTTSAHTAASHKTSTKAHKGSLHSARHTVPHARGQAAPDSDRTREIQMALIHEHYLSGEPSGSWDSETRAALTRYQADHGWQTKLVPDSRALIKLGLGPSREGLLNPDTAAISPHELGNDSPQPGGAANR